MAVKTQIVLADLLGRCLTMPLALFCAALILATGPIMAEDIPQMQRVAADRSPEEIILEVAPQPAGIEALSEEVWSDIGTERWVRNVTVPTLRPFLPPPDRATGAAIIVIPGGSFQFVSIDNEGYRIAEELADKGIAAFVLKYRVMQTPASEANFSDYIAKVYSGVAPYEGFDRLQGIPAAVADAQAALKQIKDRHQTWGIDPGRIGLLGFSAGAVTTLSLTLDTSGPQPDFIGYIYGPTHLAYIPEKLPAMFAALAADDGLFGNQGFSFIKEWQAAGGAVEFHLYETGGHGFGSYRRGVTADAWMDQFMHWMTVRGILAPADTD